MPPEPRGSTFACSRVSFGIPRSLATLECPIFIASFCMCVSFVIWLLGIYFPVFKIILWNVVFVVKDLFKRDLFGVAVVRERCQLPWIIG